MHTVRNRIASRSSIAKAELAITKPAQMDFKPPAQRASREELSLIARSGAPAEGPTMLCSMAPQRAPAGASDRTGDSRPKKRRSPKGKKASKAAVRKTEATAAMVANMAKMAQPPEGKRAAPTKRVSQPRKVSQPKKVNEANGRAAKHREAQPTSTLTSSATVPSAPPSAHPVSGLESGVMLDLCLQAEPALALVLHFQPEPLVQAPVPLTQPELEPEPAAARVLALAAMPELQVEAAKPDMVAAINDVPLPRSRALVPARRQGLVDVIAFLLRDSGRRLARWSVRRHKSKVERELLRLAEARQRAMVSELEALDGLRRGSGLVPPSP